MKKINISAEINYLVKNSSLEKFALLREEPTVLWGH